MDSTNVRLIARLKSVGQGSSEEISRDEVKKKEFSVEPNIETLILIRQKKSVFSVR